jgi:hypothetical protein
VRALALVLPLLAWAAPAAAQLTTRYVGVERFTRKATPLTATYAIDANRVALVLNGARRYRILFFADQNLMRMVDDDEMVVMDLAGGLEGGLEGMLAKALGQAPAAERQQILDMVKGRGASLPGTGRVAKPKVEFVWTRAARGVQDPVAALIGPRW